MEKKTYKPKDFAKLIGVAVITLQRWDNKGILIADRTPSNRRYYTEKHYRDYVRDARKRGKKHAEQ